MACAQDGVRSQIQPKQQWLVSKRCVLPVLPALGLVVSCPLTLTCGWH